jgi:hypothetical protein
VRRDEQAHFFVVADGGGVETGADGELPDFHYLLPSSYAKTALLIVTNGTYPLRSFPSLKTTAATVIPSNKTPLDLKLTLSFSIRGWEVANPIWRKTMSAKKNRFVEVSRRGAGKGTLALFLASGGATGLLGQGSAIGVRPETQAATVQSKFYCNTKALTPDERARHKQLSEKLVARRKEIFETAKGYEFQFSPAEISLAELAEWVRAESKCCPFFDFHIDVEREGKLLCLRLTGEEGIKAFIRAEFKVDVVK